jgi:hypothetical protein
MTLCVLGGGGRVDACCVAGAQDAANDLFNLGQMMDCFSVGVIPQVPTIRGRSQSLSPVRKQSAIQFSPIPSLAKKHDEYVRSWNSSGRPSLAQQCAISYSHLVYIRIRHGHRVRRTIEPSTSPMDAHRAPRAAADVELNPAAESASPYMEAAGARPCLAPQSAGVMADRPVDVADQTPGGRASEPITAGAVDSGRGSPMSEPRPADAVEPPSAETAEPQLQVQVQVQVQRRPSRPARPFPPPADGGTAMAAPRISRSSSTAPDRRDAAAEAAMHGRPYRERAASAPKLVIGSEDVAQASLVGTHGGMAEAKEAEIPPEAAPPTGNEAGVEYNNAGDNRASIGSFDLTDDETAPELPAQRSTPTVMPRPYSRGTGGASDPARRSSVSIPDLELESTAPLPARSRIVRPAPRRPSSGRASAGGYGRPTYPTGACEMPGVAPQWMLFLAQAMAL